MKTISLSVTLFFCMFSAHAQHATHKSANEDTTSTEEITSTKKFSMKDIKKKIAVASKGGETAQKGVDKLQELTGGRMKKKLGMLSKGITGIMKTSKDVAKISDTKDEKK